MTSSVVSGRNCRKETPGGARVNVGAGESAVLNLILATFFAKKLVEYFNINSGRVSRRRFSTVYEDQIPRCRASQHSADLLRRC